MCVYVYTEYTVVLWMVEMLFLLSNHQTSNHVYVRAGCGCVLLWSVDT